MNAHILPSRVRGDMGGENVKVADFMIHHRGIGRGSYLTGSSRFNTRYMIKVLGVFFIEFYCFLLNLYPIMIDNFRIERLWRDVRDKVIQFYMTLFQSFERDGFNINSVCHIFTLQYMFMPRIQEDLNNFKSYWNNHPLATEQNKTPLQMIILNRAAINHDEPIDMLNYGVEENVDHIEENNPCVECNPVRCPLSPANLEIFKENNVLFTMATHDNELTNRFLFTLNFIQDLIDNDV